MWRPGRVQRDGTEIDDQPRDLQLTPHARPPRALGQCCTLAGVVCSAMLASSLQPQPALHIELRCLRQLHWPLRRKRHRTRLARGRFLGTSVVDVATSARMHVGPHRGAGAAR
uniref:Uncharacterized protein n=1 Tax=Oryza sativa subsp. japonica TaxID=39947 RepID=Q5Z961_ORYSJ|nr:hypothetical protein [Oryza sativa Japonica Group]